MSLFKLNSWWDIKADNEECDFGCLCVANFGGGSSNIIVVGSYHGVLHIYSPSDFGGGEKSVDVLLETQLQAPILQVAAGKFVSVSSETHLAVLQPRTLTIYSVTVQEGAVEHGHQCLLNKIQQHKLDRTAANMAYGPFGGANGEDFLCVQSVDGALSIFESEAFAFSRFLPGFLMPGPLQYCARIDSFITLSSSRCLEAYSYQGLAVAATSSTREESQNVKSGKRITADWKLNIGENCLDIQVVTLNNGKSVIMVLGERNLFCVEETGHLQYMKKLEYEPACFCPFVSQGGETVIAVVCSHSQHLAVYEGISLKWETMLEETPVHLSVGTFNSVAGVIVTLTDSCHVSCHYLGTHPSMFHLPQSTDREPSYAAIDEELSHLGEKIKKLHTTKGDTLSQRKESDDLMIEVHVPPSIDRVSVATVAADDYGPIPSLTARLMFKVSRRVTNLQVAIQVEPPLTSSQQHFFIPEVLETEPSPCVSVSFFLQDQFAPSTLSFDVVVHFLQVAGIPKIVSKKVSLPFALVMRPHDPVKTLDHKITLETDKPCVNLLTLFPELSAAYSGPNSVGIRLIHGPRTTILTSKSSNRYRIQSDTYPGLWLLTEELVLRLRKFYKMDDLNITHSKPVELDEILNALDRHFQMRLSRENIFLMMDQRARQFRAIQHRMLTRFKDKTPSPLICLDTLLEGTYRQIAALSEACQENHNALLIASAELFSSLRLLVMLTKFWKNLTDEEEETLKYALCLNMKEANMGWEETADCCLTTLMRASSSHGDKNANRAIMNPPPAALQFPFDISKLKKRLCGLIDRLSKGNRVLQINSRNHFSQPVSNISIQHGQQRNYKLVTQLPKSKTRTKTKLHEDILEEKNELTKEDALSPGPLPLKPLSMVEGVPPEVPYLDENPDHALPKITNHSEKSDKDTGMYEDIIESPSLNYSYSDNAIEL